MSKDTAKYWQSRLIKRTYKYESEIRTYNEWYIRPMLDGRRGWIALGTANRANAAARAAVLYVQVRDKGWGSLHQEPENGTLTIGAFLDKAQNILPVSKRTFHFYSCALIKIARGITGENFAWRDDNATKRKKQKAGRLLPLSIVTRDGAENWRTAYLRSGGTASSWNSYLRSSKALFTESLCTHFGITNPFEKVRPEPISAASLKYKSRFDLPTLLRTIESQVETDKSLYEIHKLIVLLAGTGARRGELDKLKWSDVDLITGRITFEGEHLKNDASAGTIPIASFAIERLKKMRADHPGHRYVLEGKHREIEGEYRCEYLYGKAIEWLRAYTENDVQPFAKTHKPIHTLRKEVGSVLYQQCRDIYAVQRYLRHSNIKTTLAYYVDGGGSVAPSIEF